MYFFHSHNEHNKLLDVFDNANVLDCYRRSESIVPQQALALWNSKLAMTMAGKINDALHARLKDADDPKFVDGGVRDDPGHVAHEGRTRDVPGDVDRTAQPHSRT